MTISAHENDVSNAAETGIKDAVRRGENDLQLEGEVDQTPEYVKRKESSQEAISRGAGKSVAEALPIQEIAGDNEKEGNADASQKLLYNKIREKGSLGLTEGGGMDGHDQDCADEFDKVNSVIVGSFRLHGFHPFLQTVRKYRQPVMHESMFSLTADRQTV